MHLWQAFKMACKSLWTNKLRSFLTMLGIIIGVMTVSLLTTVASGVSDAVVSSIRSQSTLSIIMNTSSMASTMTSATSSSKMNYKDVNEILKNNQHNEEDEDYYNYSIIYSTNLPIAMVGDLTEIKENADVKIEDFLKFEKKTFTDAEVEAMPNEEKQLYEMYKEMYKKLAPSMAQIFAVDKNFTDVYELKIFGRFPQENDEMNEILVDEDFIKAYLPAGTTTENVLDKTFSFGIDYYTKITFDLKTNANDTIQEMVVSNLKKASIEVRSASYTDNVLVVDIEFNTMIANDWLEETLTESFGSMANSIEAKDIYDAKNAKTYKIVGVLTESADSAVSMPMGGSSSGKINFADLYTNAKGSCYIILDDDNLASLGFPETNNDGETFTKDDVIITYAYLRFKNEDVISNRINDLTLAFLSQPYRIVFMKDFMVVSMSSVAKIIGTVMDILTTMLTVISVISLVVGGIGIMNIMLVAVTERTREIGIRKAIGAKRSSILVQFLVEALMLSLIGGGIGLIISAIGSAIISSVMGIAIAMPFWVIAMSLGFCTAIGLIFGMFPAVKASHMQPIDALRRD